jgi:lactoylglutathione lyase
MPTLHYENTFIASLAGSRQRWLILVSLGLFTMRIKYVSLISLLVSLLPGQLLFSEDTTSAQTAEIDHIALHVRDLAESTRFYRSIVGLEQIPNPFNDSRHIFFRLSAHTQLHLIAGAHEGTQHDIDVHFALRVPSVASFQILLEQKQIMYFSTKKEQAVVTTRPDGIKQIYFQDPDGYWIEVNDSRL